MGLWELGNDLAASPFAARMIPGRGFADKAQLTPESGPPKTTKDDHSRFWPQSSFDRKKEFSEESLAEGFTFQRRGPPRPGQFSTIPRRVAPVIPAIIPLSESLEDGFTSPPKDKMTIASPRAPPLELPELCLPSKPTDIDSGIPEIPDQSESKPIFSTHFSHSSVKESTGPRSGLQKSAEATSKVLLAAKYTASPEFRPPSVCGDLEPPGYSKPRHHRHKDPLVRPIRYDSTKLEHLRSNSVASSNISKKRSRKRKQLLPSRSSSVASSNISKKMLEEHRMTDRKRGFLNTISECFNAFVNMNDTELAEAESEIQRLRDDLQRQEMELAESRALLSEKNTTLSETKKFYEELLESLRQQLSEEKKQSKILKEKHQESRSRLNDAIKEQQDLFLRSRDLCQEALDQLRRDMAIQTDASDAVDEALEASQKKHAEMKKCFEEYRLHVDKDIQQKDQALAVLKEKLNHQETLLAQEKLLTDTLRAQIDEMSVTRECLGTLEAKVEALMAHHTTQTERQLGAQQSTKLMKILNLKLDALIQGGNLVADKLVSRDHLAVELGAVEKSIVESLSSRISSLESGQRDSSNAVTQLESCIQQSLDRFRSEALQAESKWEQNQQINSVRTQDLFKQVQELGGGLQKTESVCENIRQKVDTLADREQGHRHTTHSLLQDLTERFLDRDVKLDGMESRLQQIHQGLTTKIDTMISGALDTDKKATKLIRSAATELRDVLERVFGQEREKISQLLVESENIAKTLAAHVDEHQHPITQTNDKSHELEANLELEREAVAQLTRKLQEVEHELLKNEELRAKWLKDIQSAEAARALLKAIQEQTSPVKFCEKKIDRLMEISEVIQSSASYLATESEWVQQELVAATPEPTVEVDNNSLAYSAGSNEGAKTQPTAKEDGTFRRVTVHSPDPGEGSPSPPPTVMQEQKRRREGNTQLRSILKGQIDQSKPPGLSNGPPSKASSSSAQMVAEICSRLVQKSLSFPTVADFERDIQLATSKKRERPQDNPITSQLDDYPSYRDPKKSRIASCV